MPHTPAASTLSVLSALLTLFGTLPAQGGSSEPPTKALQHLTFEPGTLQSDKVRRGDAGYGIYLPKAYADAANKDVKYPWIVWLHGFGGYGEFSGGGGADLLDELIGKGTLPPLAMVVFRAPGGRTTYMNSENAADTEDLIVQDLIAQVQAKYRLADARDQRAVMGVSMGGMGALKIALRHPGVFGTVAVHSAAILPADPEELGGQYETTAKRMIQRGGLDKVFGDPIEKDKWQQQMPLALVALKKPADLQGLHVYFDAGSEDRYGFFEPNGSLAAAMQKHGHKHLYRAIEGGGHAWSSPSMRENLAVSLQFVGAAFAGKDPIAAAEAAAKAQGKPAADTGK
jgi:enterochelin esterase-like enzyme